MGNETIINNTVYHAAMIMQNKVKQNKLIIEMLEGRTDREETIQILKDSNNEIEKAVEVVLKNNGCWC